MKHIIVTGLAGSGKTTIGRRIVSNNNYFREEDLICCDDYIYKEGGGWLKKDYDEYLRDIMAALNRDDHPKVIEGSYYDAHDPTNRRMRVFQLLLESNLVEMVFIISIDKITQISRLIDRCIGRAVGTERPGSRSETPFSRAQLLIKAVEGHDTNCSYLNSLADFLLATNIKVHHAPNADLIKIIDTCFEYSDPRNLDRPRQRI